MDPAGFGALLAQPALARLLDVLNGDGEETRVVGGAVRNTLLSLPIDDVDLATTAEPPTVIARARAARLDVLPTGIAHGTVTVRVDGRSFEVTTLRQDVETDGRHAVVAFGRNFDADARRRDFTMNALSLARDGTLHDPVGGLPDLEARRVRFIGDAQVRIAEDYLRILRLFRFHAAYGEGGLDVTARDAAVHGRHGLKRLSAERIWAEMKKLLIARRAPEVLAEMASTGLLGAVLGGVAYTGRFARFAEIADGPDPVARLAALAVATREDAARLRERLRLSNAATKRLDAIATVLEAVHRATSHAPPPVRVLLYRIGDRGSVRDALEIAQASDRTSDDDAVWRSVHRDAAELPIPILPVSGEDLLHRGAPPGRALGAVLKRLQARWIRAGFPGDPAQLARLVEEVIAEQR